MRLSDLPYFEEAPVGRTYLIRIQNRDLDRRMPYDPPNHPTLTIVEYHFDDEDNSIRGLDETTARQILFDFSEHKSTIDELIVNCFTGKSRSPAVALAFNDIFGLGLDSAQFRKQYTYLAENVYDTLMRVSRR